LARADPESLGRRDDARALIGVTLQTIRKGHAMGDMIDRRQTGYAALAHELEALGVRDIFGLMSQDTVNFISYAAAAAGLRFHSGRHEAISVMMADGYSWAGGGLGVVVLGRGPGLANAVNAARTVVKARHPVLLIAGDTPVTNGPGPDEKSSNTRAFAEAIGAVPFPVSDAAGIATTCRAAAERAMSGQPALLTIPEDVLNGPYVETLGDGTARLNAERVEFSPPGSDALAEAVRVLDGSRYPLVIAGRGALAAGAGARLELLAERLGALLGTTLLAKDLFRGHPYDVGVVGGFVTDAARDLLAEVDCVLAFGAGLNSRTTHQHTLFRDVPVIQIDVDPAALNAHFPIAVGVVADADDAAAALLDALAPRDGRAPFHDPVVLERLGPPLYRGADETSSEGLDPRILVERLDSLLPSDRWVVSDGGHFMGFVAVYAHVPEAGRFRLTTDFLSIGQGLGAAIGTTLAQPRATTVLFIGDGGLLMTLGDLETLARCESCVIVVVMNNQAYRAEVNHLERASLPQELALIGDVDFAAIAAALGIPASTLSTPEDLEGLSSVLEGAAGPLLLDCKIRPDVRAPHWLPGKQRTIAA
jgi:acetolactate synthase-1/2/3 large subunit